MNFDTTSPWNMPELSGDTVTRLPSLDARHWTLFAMDVAVDVGSDSLFPLTQFEHRF